MLSGKRQHLVAKILEAISATKLQTIFAPAEIAELREQYQSTVDRIFEPEACHDVQWLIWVFLMSSDGTFQPEVRDPEIGKDPMYIGSTDWR